MVRAWCLAALAILASGAVCAADAPLDQRVRADQAYRQGNFASAAELYRALAVRHRDPDSQFMLARMCLDGLSGLLGANAAQSWIESAAEQGSLAAMRWLGETAEAGAGDRLHWLRQAAQLGDTGAMAELLDDWLDARAQPGAASLDVAEAVLQAWAGRVAQAGQPAERLIAVRSLRVLTPADHDSVRRALQSVLNTPRTARAVRARAAAMMAVEPRAVEQQYFWSQVAVQGGADAPIDLDSTGLGLPRPVRLALDEGAAEYWRRHSVDDPAPARVVDQLTLRDLPACNEAAALADRIVAAFRDAIDEQQASEALLAPGADDPDLSRRLVHESRVRTAVRDFYAADGLSIDARRALIEGRCR